MNKREWRKCYKDLRDEIDQVRRECAEQVEEARREKDNANFWHMSYESLDRASTEAWDKMLAERDAALSKAEELRRDNVRLATELARVQAICDADEAQRRNLLAWQRSVREAMPEEYDVIWLGTWTVACMTSADWLRLCQAIEAGPTASDFDRKAYLAKVEHWGAAHDKGTEPKEET